MANGKKLVRSKNNQMIAGVVAGLAEYFDIDVTVARVGYALLTFFTAFSGILAYLILWLIIPQDN